MDLVQKALEFAINAHLGQKRKGNGKPYIIHPLGVALILAKVGADDQTIAAGLLHDVLEDTNVKKEELVREFGQEVADIVDDVTEQDKSLPWKVRKGQAINHIKDMGKKSLLVKTADQINNLTSMLSTYEEEGLVIFNRFNAPLREQQKMEQYLLLTLKEKWGNNPLIKELEQLIKGLSTIQP